MPSARNQKSLIKEIEDARKSRLLVYVTSDRHPFGGKITEDVVRPMYDHLLALEKLEPKREKLDLFLYSRGGDTSVPWRMASMFRQVFSEFNVLVPYKAYSAATMISLGADKIVMGRKAELGPIDPSLVRSGGGNSPSHPSEISVEDVSSYISFVKERANIDDQAALAQLIGMLSSDLTPLTLGRVNRQHSHIRLVARKLLASHQDKIDDEEKLSGIIDALTEKMYSHGHAIGRKEAKEIGLPVEEMNADLEDKTWRLFEEYENELDLGNNLYPEEILETKEEQRLKDLPTAILENTKTLHKYEIQALLRKRRNTPGNIDVKLEFSFPENINPQEFPRELQQQIGRIMQGLPEIVKQEIFRQSPVTGFEVRASSGRWVER